MSTQHIELRITSVYPSGVWFSRFSHYAAARLVCNAGKYCHITPLFFKLHWLPIRERILFKILSITYKAVHGHAPNYIKELM